MKIIPYIDGLITGLIIGILFAPRSGNETRRRLVMGFQQLRGSVDHAYETSKEAVFEELAELTNEEKDMVKERALEIKHS